MTDDKLFLLGLLWSMVQIIRTVPALVWSIRCRSTSPVYQCPPIFPNVGRMQTLRWLPNPSKGPAECP